MKDGVAASQAAHGNASGGEMRDRIASFDWSRTPLGPQESWSQSLKSHVKVLLASRYPMILIWGSDFTQFYNDAYSKLIGDKHPGALGIDIRITLAEAWDTLGPIIEEVMSTGVASWVPSLLLPLDRSGYREESYFSVSHAAAEDDSGEIVGMLAVCTEVTHQVVGDRRLRLLSDLGTRAGETRNAEAICRDLAAALAQDPLDVPFALLYLREADGQRLILCGAAGLPEGEAASPLSVDLAGGGAPAWPPLTRAAAGETVLADDVARHVTVPGGPWGEPVRSALVMPIASPDPSAPLGVLVAGVSPSRALDEGYRSFYELLAGQLSVALRNARAHEEERRRAEMLAELDRAKTTFFSNVSHELRTPLTLILGPLEESLKDPALPADRREPLETVQRNALRLLKLVNTLLDFSRIEAGRLQARYEPTDLAAFTADLAGVFRSAVEKAGLELAVDCPPLSEPVYVDRDMWEKIVLNLLSNAFKFTERGRITVRQRRAGDRVELAVEDTGCGIPEPELSRVFDRFHRIEGTRGRSHEGTGIGLSLVQELARLHGGAVTVQSREGQGSTFTVTLPLGRRHLPAEHVGSGHALTPTSIRTESYTLEALHWLPETPGIRPADPDVPSAAGPRPRVLLADDNADMREYVRKLLSSLYEIAAVPDGEAAWLAAEERLPDLILSDVMMPRLDGFGLLARLREEPSTRSVPVILLSARAGEEARVEGLEAGADDYLIKPFGARELLARVAATLERARLREESARARSEARAAAERAALLESITDCFYALDREWRFTYVNGPCATYYGLKREELLGRVVWEVFPVAVGSPFDEHFHRAAREQVAVHFEVLSPLTKTWLEVHAYPSSEGLSVNFRDITRRQEEARMREELLQRERAARNQAEEASRLKDEFLSTVSHELRTPLNAVLGWAQLLRQRGIQETGVAEGLEVIERNARAQVKLIEDLLDLGRIISGKVRLDVQPTDLAAILRAAVETIQPTADVKGIRLSTVIEPHAGRMVGDPNRLHQVISNLLSNALKFTPKGGQVLVTLERIGSSLVLTLADTGIGIEPDFLPYVFDRFRQADGSTTRRHGGLGIGLSIVKHLVELHGGSVQAHSEGRDQGTSFVVTLPVAAIQPRPHGPGEEDRHHGGSASDPAPEDGPRLSAKKILVVDDEADARELVRRLLEEREAEVATAASGREALQLLANFRPDVLVSDIGMPDLDGYELIRKVRAFGADQGGMIPAVALTALARKEDRTRALLAGYQVHVAKPVEPSELIAMVASLAGLIGKG